MAGLIAWGAGRSAWPSGMCEPILHRVAYIQSTVAATLRSGVVTLSKIGEDDLMAQWAAHLCASGVGQTSAIAKASLVATAAGIKCDADDAASLPNPVGPLPNIESEPGDDAPTESGSRSEHAVRTRAVSTHSFIVVGLRHFQFKHLLSFCFSWSPVGRPRSSASPVVRCENRGVSAVCSTPFL